MQVKTAIVIFGAGVVALGVAAVSIVGLNVWAAERSQLNHAPGAVDEGRASLHAQLLQASNREAEIEKQEWNSPGQLYVLIDSHKQRIAEMGDNPEGKELVAHDQQAIDRLQKRIAAIYAEREAAAERQAELDAAAAAEGDSPAAQTQP